MPMIDLTLPAGALQRSALTTLVEDLTTTALHWEGIPDTPASRAMAWVFVHELPSGAVNVGGRAALNLPAPSEHLNRDRAPKPRHRASQDILGKPTAHFP